MTLSLSLLWLTNETTEGTAAPLAFSDAGDTTGGLGVLIAFGLWTAACIQIRKRVDATP